MRGGEWRGMEREWEEEDRTRSKGDYILEWNHANHHQRCISRSRADGASIASASVPMCVLSRQPYREQSRGLSWLSPAVIGTSPNALACHETETRRGSGELGCNSLSHPAIRQTTLRPLARHWARCPNKHLLHIFFLALALVVTHCPIGYRIAHGC